MGRTSWRHLLPIIAAFAILVSSLALSANRADAATGPTLRKGITHSSVKTLQQALDTNKSKDYFVYNNGYTTYFGDITLSGLKQWENANRSNRSVKVDGIITVNSAEWTLLMSQRKPAPVPSKTTVTGLDARCYKYASVICVNRATNKLVYLENGKVLQTQDVRTARPGYVTRLGDHVVYGKDANAWSSLYNVRMPYSIMFDGGIYVHYSAEFNRVGYGYPYGSHGCVNERDMTKAIWLYNHAIVGKTHVVVYETKKTA